VELSLIKINVRQAVQRQHGHVRIAGNPANLNCILVCAPGFLQLSFNPACIA
jgi:hypothetical protein